MAETANTSRFAVLAVLAVLVVGIAACGEGETQDPVPGIKESDAPAAPPTTGYAPAAGRTRPPPSRLSATERRQARRQLQRLRKATSKPSRGVVTDSGVIP
jgi:hypothetical protein